MCGSLERTTEKDGPGNAFCQKLQITWDWFQIQAAPCPLLEASPQMPPAQAPSPSVTRKVVQTMTVTGNENPGGLPRNEKKTVCWRMQWFALNASLEGLSCLPPGTLRGSICDRVFCDAYCDASSQQGGEGGGPTPAIRSIPGVAAGDPTPEWGGGGMARGTTAAALRLVLAPSVTGNVPSHPPPLVR